MASGTLTGPLYATAATSAIGLSVAVSKLLIHYPVLSAQAVRYAIGAAALLAVARLRRQRLPRPTGQDLALLLALGATGLAGFNILLLAALERAEPAAVGVVVGCVPVLLALAGPLLARRAPSAQVVGAAVLAAVGAGVVQGGGEATAAGLAAAAGALAAEALFSLLAVPLLPRLGPLAVSAYACLAAVVLLGIGAPLLDGPMAFQVPTAGEAGAVAFLGLVVTAGAFVAWYAALDRLGVERAGLFNGLIPIATLAGAVLIGTGSAGLRETFGATLVGAGIVLGLLRRHPPERPSPPPHPEQRGAAPRTDQGPARRPPNADEASMTSGGLTGRIATRKPSGRRAAGDLLTPPWSNTLVRNNHIGMKVTKSTIGYGLQLSARRPRPALPAAT